VHLKSYSLKDAKLKAQGPFSWVGSSPGKCYSECDEQQETHTPVTAPVCMSFPRTAAGAALVYMCSLVICLCVHVDTAVSAWEVLHLIKPILTSQLKHHFLTEQSLTCLI